MAFLPSRRKLFLFMKVHNAAPPKSSILLNHYSLNNLSLRHRANVTSLCSSRVHRFHVEELHVMLFVSHCFKPAPRKESNHVGIAHGNHVPRCTAEAQFPNLEWNVLSRTFNMGKGSIRVLNFVDRENTAPQPPQLLFLQKWHCDDRTPTRLLCLCVL